MIRAVRRLPAALSSRQAKRQLTAEQGSFRELLQREQLEGNAMHNQTINFRNGRSLPTPPGEVKVNYLIQQLP
jgi:hypothetical protein